ncbi:MAG: bifunctional oligoribonuclease/PAP phosphatase NrnA [Bacilli bacterium]
MRLQKNKIEELINKIEQYDSIAIFRHEAPDFDALGSQNGLYFWLKNNFPNKKFFVLGDSNSEVGKNLFPNYSIISDEELFSKPFLGILLDTSDQKRISDKRFLKADYKIKIDHHPADEHFADLEIINTDFSAVGELLYAILTNKIISKKYKFNTECAKYLYVAIAGDTSRFQNSNTTYYTFVAAAGLLKQKFDLMKDVYMPMYNRTIKDLEIEKRVMSKYKISKGGNVAYYHLEKSDLEEFDIDSDDAKKYLSLFTFCDEIKVWVCFAYDSRKENYRVSIRSRDVIVNKVANKYAGGGHKFASGARAKDYEETLNIIKDLDQEIINQCK